MGSEKLYYMFLFFLLSGNCKIQGSPVGSNHSPLLPTTLFVFGDSYADTGNNGKSAANSWKYPYGITFPGKPTGRFSDGRVLTDFLAKFLGVKSPIPYKYRKIGAELKRLQYGMNFAHGGTGVFDTLALGPNMTTQIDYFRRLVNDSVFTAQDLLSSAALVSFAGNDYALYQATNGSTQGWKPFITSVVNQLAVNLKRIQDVGVKKIVVTALEPLGCLPSSTAQLAFQQCNETENSLVSFHNLMLQQVVTKLNNETNSSVFLVLDLYGSFVSVIKSKANRLGTVKFENPLKPCCAGISMEYSCGSVAENGEKKYTICEEPASAFFWDDAHPTQEGWNAVYYDLEGTLHQLH